MSAPTDFDKELDEALNRHMRMLKGSAVSSYEAKVAAKEAIREAVDKYVIGEDQSHRVTTKVGEPVDSYVMRSELRQSLWGTK